VVRCKATCSNRIYYFPLFLWWQSQYNIFTWYSICMLVLVMNIHVAVILHTWCKTKIIQSINCSWTKEISSPLKNELSPFKLWVLYNYFTITNIFDGKIFYLTFKKEYIQINTWAFPYWPGYHLETPILARDGVLKRDTHIGLIQSRGPYWPGPIWKWSCSNPITGYFPEVWKYGQFTSGHNGHTKMPLFELSM
jgi:hypothetical protein